MMYSTEREMHADILERLEKFDFENTLKVFTKEAFEKGKEIGIEIGKRKIGKEIGAKENALQNAKMMLIENFPDETILRITKISQAELDELKTP